MRDTWIAANKPHRWIGGLLISLGLHLLLPLHVAWIGLTAVILVIALITVATRDQ